MEYPEQVDVVVLGTGFVQAVIACAAARRGKSLFIVDANAYYGESAASLSLTEFQEWAQRHQSHTEAVKVITTSTVPALTGDEVSQGAVAAPVPEPPRDVHALRFNMYMDPHAVPRRGYSIDLVHQAMESTGPCAQAIRDIGIHHSLDFSAVSSVYTWHAGRLYSTPSSRADVHAAPWLSLQDKRTLSLFLANAQHAAIGGASDLFQAANFKAAMEDFGLHPSVQDGLLYSVFQSERAVSRNNPLRGEKVLEAMVKYMAQSGAYVAGQAPYIECRYGSSEVAQAFVRQACVHGGAVALGTPASHILVRDGAVHGVRLASGCVIKCSAIFASPSYLEGLGSVVTEGCAPQGTPQESAAVAAPSPVDSGEEAAAEEEEEARSRVGTMARGIVLLRRPVLPHMTNCQVVFPPGACGNEHTVTIWHCHHTLAVCPAPCSLLHLSMPQAEDEAALQALEDCVAALLKVPDDNVASSDKNGTDQSDAAATSGDGSDGSDPIVLEAYFLQKLAGPMQLCKGAVCCPPLGRDWTLDNSLLIAERLFKKMYPEDVFLTQQPPVTAASTQDDEVDPLDAAMKALGLE